MTRSKHILKYGYLYSSGDWLILKPTRTNIIKGTNSSYVLPVTEPELDRTADRIDHLSSRDLYLTPRRGQKSPKVA